MKLMNVNKASSIIDCKTVGFSLIICKEIGKGWRKSLTREPHKANISCPLNFRLFVSCQLKFWPLVSNCSSIGRTG